MAQNNGRLYLSAAFATFIDMYVCAADTASADAQQHLAFAGFGQIQITNFNRFVTQKVCTSHFYFLRPCINYWSVF